MLLGYNTNGFAHHTPEQALEVLAAIGYQAVGLTIDHGVLDPRDPHAGAQAGRLRRLARRHDLALVIETGGRYLLDAWVKHEPTLVSADPERRAVRVAFYQQAFEAAAEVGARCVSLWSGVVRDAASRDEAFARLVGGLGEVLLQASRVAVPLAFEPEPGMLVATLADFSELRERVAAAGAPVDLLRLTIDVGHLHCQGETPIDDRLAEHADLLENLHLEDMRAGVHEHLMFGEGEIDFAPVLSRLEAIGYEGPALVELSRHSHEAPVAAWRAMDYLRELRSTNDQAPMTK